MGQQQAIRRDAQGNRQRHQVVSVNSPLPCFNAPQTQRRNRPAQLCKVFSQLFVLHPPAQPRNVRTHVLAGRAQRILLFSHWAIVADQNEL